MTVSLLGLVVRSARLVAWALVLVLVVAACGGSESSSTTAGGSESSSTTAGGSTSLSEGSDGSSTSVGGGDAEWDAVVAAAKEEGLVQTYMTASQHLLDSLNAAFNAKYPEIRVELFRTPGTPPLLERIQNDIDAGSWQADVVNLADPLWLADAQATGLVNTDVVVPSAGLWDPQFFSDGAAVLFPSVFAVIYNTELVSEDELPKGWEDMADERWKGRMAIFEPRQGTDSHTVLYQYYLEQFGEEFLSKIADLNPQVWDSANPLAESVAAGEAHIGVTFTHKAEALKNEGAPVEYILFDPAPAFRNVIFVPNDAPRPNAARVYLDFAMSPEGQTAIAGNRTGHSVLDIPDVLELDANIYFADAPTAVDNIPRMMELLNLSR